MRLLLSAGGRFLIGSVLAIPTLLYSQPSLSPSGVEYSVAGTLPGDQVFSHAAISPAGGYVVWQDNSVTTAGARIRALQLNNSFAAGGSPFVVSSATSPKLTGNQEKPRVALLQGGGAVIVWQGGLQGAQEVYARFLDPNGLPLGKDIRVNTYTKSYQITPDVAGLTDGSVMVVWASYAEDGDKLGVYGQHLSAAGAKLGKEFQINQFTQNNQRTPALAALTGGGFVVVWVSELERTSASVDVYGRLYSNALLPVGNEFPVNTTTSNACANPCVTGSPNGGFAVAWSQNDNVSLTAGSAFGTPVSGAVVSTVRSTNSWDIFGRIFDPSANAITVPFRLNTYTLGDQFVPKIAAAGTNYFAVWSSLSQPDPHSGVVDPWEGVFGQLVTGAGALVYDNDLHVNSTTAGRQIQPTVVSDGASHLLVIWSSLNIASGTFDFDLYGQQYLQFGGQ